jgi:uncharacterized membrane protein
MSNILSKAYHSWRKYFITGLLVILPLWITIYVLWLLMGLIGSMVNPILKMFFLGKISIVVIRILSFVISLFLIWLLGLITANIIGKKIFSTFENMIAKMPFVKDVYGSVKQLVGFFSAKKVDFRHVVIIEFPRKGIYTIGFITNEKKYVIGTKKLVNVFYPTTPNPTTGFYMLIPEDELIYSDIKVDEAIKIIMSGGVLFPDNISITDNTIDKSKCD